MSEFKTARTILELDHIIRCGTLRVAICTTSSSSQVINDVQKNLHPAIKDIRQFYINTKGYDPAAWLKQLKESNYIQKGVAVLFVRGGGEPDHYSFKPFTSGEFIKVVKTLQDNGVIVGLGVGHNDPIHNTAADYLVDLKASTPSELSIHFSFIVQEVFDNIYRNGKPQDWSKLDVIGSRTESTPKNVHSMR